MVIAAKLPQCLYVQVKLIDCPQVAMHNYVFYLETILARPVVHLKTIHVSIPPRSPLNYSKVGACRMPFNKGQCL